MDVPLNIINVILWIVGGLAIFLYGIELMGKALRRGVGKALRQGLNRFTKTPIHGLLTGTVLTGLIQSSSAATVMIVGFISAGLLTFSKSIGLILGANIGTTITPQITALKLDGYAVPIIAVGFLLNFISKKRVYRELGNAVMGVGFLLFGLLLMKFAVSGYSEIINHWLSYYTDAGARGWILAFAISIITTSIIQSSAATVVIIQALALQGAITNIGIAIPMILGAGVGTCITALLATLKSGHSAKRAALAHLVFNIMGTLITLFLIKFYLWLIPLTSVDISHQIANCHLAIKVINAFIFLPFANIYAGFIVRIFPGEDRFNTSPQFITPDEKDPGLALSNISKEIRRLCVISSEMVSDAVAAFLKRDEVKQEEVLKGENLVDVMFDTITDYTRDSAQMKLSPALSTYPAYLLHLLNHVERIADHAENIVELSRAYTKEDAEINVHAVEELNELVGLILQISESVHFLMEAWCPEQLDRALRLRKRFKRRRLEMLMHNEARLASNQCKPLEGIVFVDLIDNLMSVVTHLGHIARSVEQYN